MDPMNIQHCFCLRTFAQAVPSTWNALPPDPPMTPPLSQVFIQITPSQGMLSQLPLSKTAAITTASVSLNFLYSTYHHLMSYIFCLISHVFLIRMLASGTENLVCLVHCCVPST